MARVSISIGFDFLPFPIFHFKRRAEGVAPYYSVNTRFHMKAKVCASERQQAEILRIAVGNLRGAKISARSRYHAKILLSFILSVQAAVINPLQNMLFLYFFRKIQIRYRSRNFNNPASRTSG